jgi:hypothetical protein
MNMDPVLMKAAFIGAFERYAAEYEADEPLHKHTARWNAEMAGRMEGMSNLKYMAHGSVDAFLKMRMEVMEQSALHYDMFDWAIGHFIDHIEVFDEYDPASFTTNVEFQHFVAGMFSDEYLLDDDGKFYFTLELFSLVL